MAIDPPSPAETAFLALQADPKGYAAWAKAARLEWLKTARGRDALATVERWKRTRPTLKGEAA